MYLVAKGLVGELLDKSTWLCAHLHYCGNNHHSLLKLLSDHSFVYLQNGASFLGNITSILQSQQAEVASLLQGPTPTLTPRPGLPLPNIGCRLQQAQV